MERTEPRLIQLLQSARPMRVFRNCRYLSREAVEEITALTADASPDDPVGAVGHAVHNAKQAPFMDGRRVRSKEIDTLLARLGA
jgi:hypothetical protein